MNILVSDFDGTLTRYDFFDQVRKRWPLPPEADPWNKYMAGEITHFTALASIFASIRASETELREIVDSMEIADGLAGAISDLHTSGWEVVIASAGCEWYIRILLAKAGVSLPLHTNPGAFDPELGLQMRAPVNSPFLSPTTGIDKVSVVRDALGRAPRVAFAGDGPPDLPAILLIEPELRFARGWLGQALEERGETFHRFENWPQIASHLQRIS